VIEERYARWLFDPTCGETVREPPGSGPGYWVGAVGARHDPQADIIYLYYRLRKPRELGRGYECRIARSDDGLRFEDIWSATKEQLETESMERGALWRTPEGRWRLYLGLVDPDDRRWRIDMMEADSPERLDPARRAAVLTAADIGAEGVKDPYLVATGDGISMIASYAPSPARADEVTARAMHATGDIYNTGVTRSHTGLAMSADGRRFEWRGDVLSPGDGWDAYAARIGSVLATEDGYLAFYDGSAHVGENYEERTGLAVSRDLTHWRRLTPDAPALVSPEGSGSLRYVDALRVSDQVLCYYEYTRADGSHELRVSRADAHR
jgi:hypothetical protein